MIGAYGSLLVLLVASLVIGQALVAFARGARRGDPEPFSWLAPAVGIGALLVVAGAAARLPGEGVSAAIAATDPILSQIPGIEFLIAQFDLLFTVSAMDPTVSTSDIVYTNNFVHGFMVMEAMAESLTATVYEIPYTEVGTSYYDDPEALDALFNVLRFTVQDGVLIPG